MFMIQRRPSRPAGRTTRRLVFECLEIKRPCATDVTVHPDHIEIEGDNTDNRVLISLVTGEGSGNYRVTDDAGLNELVPKREIRFVGKDGNDILDASVVTNVVKAWMGNGNDRATTGSAGDIVHGGPGDDFLRTNAGRDNVFGEIGNDDINPGGGADFVDAGNGNNRIDVRDGHSDWLGDRIRNPKSTDTILRDPKQNVAGQAKIINAHTNDIAFVGWLIEWQDRPGTGIVHVDVNNVDKGLWRINSGGAVHVTTYTFVASATLRAEAGNKLIFDMFG